MVEIPTPQDVIGFIVFFFPGFISLLITTNLTDTELKDRSLLEVIVVSFVFSALSFALAGLFVTIGPDLLLAETTPASSSAIFASSVVVGMLMYLFLGVWLSIARKVSDLSIGLRGKLMSEIDTFGPSSAYLLDQAWKNKDKNYLVVTTRSGEIYRGTLTSFSIKPRFEVVIQDAKDRPISKFTQGKWEQVGEWMILFPEEDISRLHVRKI